MYTAEGPQSREYMTGDLPADMMNYNNTQNSVLHDSFSGSGHNNNNNNSTQQQQQQHNNSIINSHNAHDEQLVGPTRGGPNDIGEYLYYIVYSVYCVYVHAWRHCTAGYMLCMCIPQCCVHMALSSLVRMLP
jgi:hypothetical protein